MYGWPQTHDVQTVFIAWYTIPMLWVCNWVRTQTHISWYNYEKYGFHDTGNVWFLAKYFDD